MKEILLSSSVLILVIAGLRPLFRSRVAKRFQYALWGLVALRLLVPIQFGQFQFSVNTIAQASPPIAAIEQQIREPLARPEYDVIYENVERGYENQGFDVSSPEIIDLITAETEERIDFPTWGEALRFIWFTGIAFMAVWFTIVNLRFHHRVHSNAVRLQVESPIPVYESDWVQSPCLMGLFRPTIFLPPSCAEEEKKLRHVLAHELTHLRHGDHLWSLVRCVCLCVYWFDPLVWLAAVLSRRDCELACDEGALKRLGEQERLDYGRTLLQVVSNGLSPNHLMETATAMNESKRQLVERVNFIAKKPKLYITAAVLLVLLTAIAAGCTFTGGIGKKPKPDEEFLLLETVSHVYQPDGSVTVSWTRNHYSDEGLLSSVEEYSGGTLYTHTPGYDDDGNMTVLTSYDPNGVMYNKATFTYDSSGYLLSQKESTNAIYPPYRTTKYTYDNDGNVLTMTESTDNYTSKREYTYDGDGRTLRMVIIVDGRVNRRLEYNHAEDGLSHSAMIYDGEDVYQGTIQTEFTADKSASTAVITLADGTQYQRTECTYDDDENLLTYRVWQEDRLTLSTENRYIRPGGKQVYSLMPGETAADPYTMAYPGTEWGMTPEELIDALKLKEGNYTAIPFKDDDGSYCLNNVHMMAFGADAEIIFEFKDQNSDGVSHLCAVYAAFPDSTDFNALTSVLKETYGDTVFPEKTEWESEAKVIDYMSDEDIALLESLICIQDSATQGWLQSPVTTIYLQTDGVRNLYAAQYQGETVYNVLIFRSSAAYYTHEGGYTETYNSYQDTTDDPDPTGFYQVPEGFDLSDLVWTAREEHLQWRDSAGSLNTVDIRIPAIYAFSYDAAIINNTISGKFDPIVEQILSMQEDKVSTHIHTIDYQTFLNGDLLSLVIWEDTSYDLTNYHVYNFYLPEDGSGIVMNTAAMARATLDISYPEFLYAATKFVEDAFAAEFSQTFDGEHRKDYDELYAMIGLDTVKMSAHRLYLDENATLMLRFDMPSPAGASFYPTVLPFSAVDTDPAECYDWLFNLHSDGAYAAAHGLLLCNAFLADPDEFMEQVLRQPEDTAANTIRLLAFGAWDGSKNGDVLVRETLARYPDSEFKSAVLDSLDKLG